MEAARRPELVRAARAQRVLQGLARPLRAKIDFYHMSHTAKPEVFWSHSWHGSVPAKVATVFFLHNATAATTRGSVVSRLVLRTSLGMTDPGVRSTRTQYLYTMDPIGQYTLNDIPKEPYILYAVLYHTLTQTLMSALLHILMPEAASARLEHPCPNGHDMPHMLTASRTAVSAGPSHCLQRIYEPAHGIPAASSTDRRAANVLWSGILPTLHVSTAVT